MPLNMYVEPVNGEATEPPEFTQYATVPADPLSLPPDQISANRDAWVTHVDEDRPRLTASARSRGPPRGQVVGLPGAGAGVGFVVPLAFLGVFFLYPVGAIVVRGLRPSGHWQLGVFADVLGDPYERRIMWFSRVAGRGLDRG